MALGGDSPHHVLAMGNYLANKYNAVGWIIYITNQGTDEHRSHVNEPIPYRNIDLMGIITDIMFNERGMPRLFWMRNKGG
ncbi:hypothetical protein [Vulcanisaeta distributa]|uniref:hypothetical protein n=1 Tax=Vulcanisaeta distributa TaxID=164451 RepID=UPI001FB24EEC|nr:hypothetical protein [Vulcanisaeta distributa]